MLQVCTGSLDECPQQLSAGAIHFAWFRQTIQIAACPWTVSNVAIAISTQNCGNGATAGTA